MITRENTLEMSREQWLEARRKSLGGSDIAAVLGLNPYDTPYTVWADKLGIIPPKEDNEAIRIGRDLEPYVIQRFEEASGLRTSHVHAILRNDKYPHLHADIDRKVKKAHEGVEAKTASVLTERRYENGNFPTNYYCQCVQYLAITEYERWYLAVLILGKGFKIYRLTRIKDDPIPEWCESSVYVSDDEISALTSAGAAFWEEYIIPQKSPAVDGEKATTEAITAIYTPDSEAEEEKELFGASEDIEIILALKERRSQIDTEIELHQNRVKEMLGKASVGVCEGVRIRWKPQVRNTFDRNRFASDHPHIDLMPYFKQSTSRPFYIEKI